MVHWRAAATRSRVEQAIADLEFFPNRAARGLISGKTGAIGLTVPDLVNPFFTVVVRGAEMWRGALAIACCSATRRAIWHWTQLHRRH